MNKNSSLAILAILASLGLGLAFLSTSQAQTEEPDPGFQIRPNDLKTALVATPNWDGGLKGKTTRRKTPWLEAEVSFSWQPSTPEDRENPYLDELTVNFFLLLETRSREFPAALLKGSTTLRDVAASSGSTLSTTAMFVSPRSLEHLFDGKVPATANAIVSNFGVTLDRGGKTVAMAIMKGNAKFWEGLPEQVKSPEGYLMKKSATPFAAAVWDYYEQEKVEP
jgi:hypothetical protein